MVVTEAFEAIARATFASRGRADHPLVILPSTTALADTPELTQSARFVVETSFG